MGFRTLLRFLLLFGIAFSTQAINKPAPIYIGIDADLSAVAVDGGLAIQRGTQIAVDEINQSGGLLGREVQVIAMDHRGNPARGVANLKQLAHNEDLLAVVGGVHTPVVLAELEFIHQQNMLFLIPWAAGTQLVDNQFSPNNIFRVSVRDADAASVLMAHARSLQAKSIALVLERTGWGRSNYRSLSEAAELLDIDITSVHWINWQQKSFSTDVAQIKSAGVDAVVLVANAPEGATVVNALHKQGLATLPIISHWGIASGNFADLLDVSPSQLNLSVLQTFHFSKQTHGRAQHLLAQYQEKYGPVTPHSIRAKVGLAHAYDLVHLLANATRMANTFDITKIKTAMENLPLHEGAVKTYRPAFSKDMHDALNASDYFMVTMDDNGHLVLLSNQ